jgi:Ni,Fe-hydrogenase III large subunit
MPSAIAGRWSRSRAPTCRARAAAAAVLLELERLYNHVGDVGMIVNDTGFAFGHAHCFRCVRSFCV